MPKALLLLQLLIAFITRSAVNVRDISNTFLLVSLITIRISLEVCPPSVQVFNCWLNLVATCLDDDYELPFKVIASFSAINSFNGSLQLGDICLLVQGLKKKFPLYALMHHRFWMA